MSSIKIWESMSSMADKLLLEKVKPNPTLVEEALSFNASDLDTIPEDMLRKYIVVLGQYLITVQYEENKIDAMCAAWQRSLESHVYHVIHTSTDIPAKIKTLAEKKSWVLDNDEEALLLNNEYLEADAKAGVIRNLHKPIEQYIQTLKKEIDARENEKRRM